MYGKCFDFTYGAPNLKEAIRTLNPRHITRPPRKSDPLCHMHLQLTPEMLEGADIPVYRKHDAVHNSYNSFYVLAEPVEATAVVMTVADDGVFAQYEPAGPRQGARFYIEKDKVPVEQRTTRIVKVAERKIGRGKFKKKMVTSVPEEAFLAYMRGDDVPGDVVARLNHVVSQHGVSSELTDPLWAALKGERPICVHFI